MTDVTTSNTCALALALYLFASALSAQNIGITLEYLPGLASDGLNPISAMVPANDGTLYGSTREGGVHDHGTLYRVIPGATPSVSTVYSFDKETYSPDAPMVVASDGSLYGVTSIWKKLYRLKPGPVPTVSLFPFSFEGNDNADDILVPARDGALYGTIKGGKDGAGGIYRVALGANPAVSRVWIFKDGGCITEQEQDRRKQKWKRTAIDAVISTAAASRRMFESCEVGHLGLVAASDGNLYGATHGAGEDGRSGFVYRVIPGDRPRAEILFTYNGKGGAAWSPGSLVAANDGKLYGTMIAGGPHNLGTVFVIKPGAKPVMTTLLPIKSPEFRDAKLRVAGQDGRLYGLSSGGAKGCGSAFVVSPGAVPRIETLLSFSTEQQYDDCTYNGAEATLVAGGDGALYGTLTPTGDYNDGVGGIFRVITGATPSAARILSFSPQLGYQPHAPLVAAGDGKLYGTTSKGAAHEGGSIFQLTPEASELKRLFSFDSQSSVESRSALTEGADGEIYGTARTCCSSEGIAFKVHTGADPHVSLLYSFHSGYSDGGPDGALVADMDGRLYGLTHSGGARHQGSVYRVTTGDEAAVSPLYDFDSASGAEPDSQLIAARDGRLYGTTQQGGASGMGTIFEVTPGATKPVSMLYSYDAQTGYPDDGLIVGDDGRLYGSTYRSKNGCGTIYRFTPGTPGGVEILHTFDQHSCWRHSELAAAADGALYLATLGNGSDDDGRILKVTTGDKASVVGVGSFSDGNRFSDVTLFAGGDGNIYGAAFGPEDEDGGALFQIVPGATATISTLLSFDGKLWPDSMVAGKDGYLYGTSRKGGAHGLGALLRYKPGSRFIDLLYSFSDTGDGAYPSTPLMLHSDGYFYGMTLQPSMRSNGRASLGRVFRFRPAPP